MHYRHTSFFLPLESGRFMTAVDATLDLAVLCLQPNMLVIRGVMGTKKTAVYVALVIVMATVSGNVIGVFF